MDEHKGEERAVVAYQPAREGDVLPAGSYEQQQEQKVEEFVQQHMRRYFDNLERRMFGLPPLREQR